MSIWLFAKAILFDMSGKQIIFHVITGLGIGGAETALLQLLKASAGTESEHVIFTLSTKDDLTEAVRKTGARVIPLRTSGLTSIIGSVLRVRSLIKSERPLLLMTWMHHADLFGAVLKCFCPSLPLVWNIRCSKLEVGYLPKRNLQIVNLLAKLSWLPAAIVSNSYAGQREHIAVGYRRKGWRVLHNGFDTETLARDPEVSLQMKEKLGYPAEAILIGLIARYHPMKGFDLFIRAAGRLACSEKSVHYVLVGNEVHDQNQELLNMIVAAGLEGRVSLLGQRQDIPNIMTMLDVVVSASTSEGFPNVVGEAMACGTPCVVTDVGDSAVLVGEVGKIIASGDEDGLVSALSELINMSSEEFEDLRYLTRSRIVSYFSRTRMSERYQELFDEFTTSH